MKDTESLIYNELVALREDLKSYMDRTDKRILSLEKFKEKAMGICIAIGVAGKCMWDYIVERVI
jgi:hypothetical protein